MRDNDFVAGSMTAAGKRERAEALLGSGGMLVYVDARDEHVLVPFRHKHRNQLILPVGAWRDGEGAILQLSDAGLTGTLRFNRMTWPCHLPWNAICALAGMDGQGTFWRGEARDDPTRGQGVEVVPINEQFHHYLIVNGQAIVGKGNSVLVIQGQEFRGVRWIEWNGRRVRVGGDLQELARLLGGKLDVGIRRVRFSVGLGYSAGKQQSQVNWDSCRVKSLSDGIAEFRAGSYYDQHFGVCGPLPYLREWLFRLRAFFARKR